MATVENLHEFIEVDHGGQRYTHHPSGDTLMRHQWMQLGRAAPQWDAKRRDFFCRHPEATALAVVRRGARVVIGDVRDFPWQEGLKVGDDVVTVGYPDREADCSRRIVGTVPITADADVFEDAPRHCFLLEDGDLLYWSVAYDAWMTRSSDGRPETRARRPYPGEDVEELRIPSAAMLVKVMPLAADVMSHAAFRLHEGCGVTRGDASVAFGCLHAAHMALAMEWAERERSALWGDPSGMPSLELVAAAADALSDAADITAKALSAGVVLGWDGEDVIRYAAVIEATLEARGERRVAGISLVIPTP